MRLDILTLFPEMFTPLESSIIGRAREKKLIEINVVNFRDYSADKHKKVDDKPFGGGDGMLLTCQPIYDCVQALDPENKAKRIYMCPKGKIFNEQIAKNLASEFDHIIILCGHYEGVDERVLTICGFEKLSIGEFVLTGGEIPAMVVVDAVARLCDGVLSRESCFENESFYNGYLEYPQYTRPQEFMGLKVPNVLVSGNHAQIEKWKKENMVKVDKGS